MRSLILASLACMMVACGQPAPAPVAGPNPSALAMDGGGVCGAPGHLTLTDTPDNQPGKTCPHGSVSDGDQQRSFDVRFDSNPADMTGWSWQENGTQGTVVEVEGPQSGNDVSCGSVHVKTQYNATDDVERWVIFDSSGVRAAWGEYHYTTPGETEPCTLFFNSSVQAVP